MTIESRRIGTTAATVTNLGFGSAPLGAAGGRISEDEVGAMLTTAWESGIRYYDTAPLYGHGLAEKRLGSTLAGLDRDEFTISTKIGRLLDPNGERYAGMRDNEPFGIRHDYSYAGVRASLESSLERLGLDRIDILLCHDIDVWTHGDDQPRIYDEAITGALLAMRDLRDEGVVSAIGLGVNEWQVCSQVMDVIDIDCCLLAGRFTLLEQDALDEMLPKCIDKDVSVVIGGPYNSGLLTNIERQRATYDYKPASDELWERRCQILDVCERHDVDIRAAALQYPLRHPAVAAVIPGPRSVDEVTTNRALVDTEIPEQLWADLAGTGLSRSW